ncbi:MULTISPECIES: hypothetical protein [Kitasatospora]|uniref:Sigma-70-like protein n=1 Tax=Kitasatospora herbaricolor TaxID=68217 RepID=A0ABZ1WLW6_9ACTN|nr:hypothetical protein [Kitasatospora herbaricolor]
MPSEGRPLPIDTARITAPADVPPTPLSTMAYHRDVHRARALGFRQDLGPATAADPLAALALGVTIARKAVEEQHELVQAALQQGSSWQEIAAALDVSVTEIQSRLEQDTGVAPGTDGDDG